MHEQVVGYLDAFPALVAVHCVVAADYRCYLAGRFCAVLFKFGYEALSAAGVGVAAVHEAVDVNLLKSVVLGYVTQREEVVER